jgi:hypothetical protein
MNPVDRVTGPERRADVVAALTTLATLRQTMKRPDVTEAWPGLGEAVHWLVDDTWWDARDPADDVGTLLRDADEAAAVSAVLAPLLEILDEVGPTARDAEFVAHRRWHETAIAASRARKLLTRDDPG